MQFILMDYVGEGGWPELTRDEQIHWLGAVRRLRRGNVKGWYPEEQ